MNFADAEIKNILLKGNYIGEQDLKKAEDFARSGKVSVVEYLFTNGLLTPDLLGQAIAENFGMNYADLNSRQPSRTQVLKIPESIAKKYGVILFSEKDGELVITTDNPKQDKAPLIEAIKNIFPGKEIQIDYSLPEDVEANLIHYRKPLETRFAKIIKAKKHIAPEIIDEIFEDAISYRASDIHFDPQPEEIVVRFRVDGKLSEAGEIPKEFYENILNRIKVEAGMRIDDHFSAQDGAIRYVRKDNSVIDMRISVAPMLDGEKVAIRLLAEYVRSFTLGDLGLSFEDQKIITDAAKKPFGMIIVTGPTGSGKTTTLYALVKILNTPEVNITTIEDPVEYKIEGVNQIQVNPQTNLTYAKGLRSILREDPDIILVGEIRDNLTAEISVNAALTGHLLLTTFHANDAATAIPRLLDMRIEPFLLASTADLIMAQRLVRKICDVCRRSNSVKRQEIEKMMPEARNYFKSKSVTLYKGKGCDACHNTGYRGRTAIFEFINITSEMKDLILKNPSTKEILKLAKKQGAHSMFEDGIKKVKGGITTLEELLRVTQP